MNEYNNSFKYTLKNESISERNSKEKGMSDDEVVKRRIEREKDRDTENLLSQCLDPKDPVNRVMCRRAVNSKSDMSHDWHRLYGHELRRGGNNKEDDFERANKRMVKRYGTDEITENNTANMKKKNKAVRLSESSLRKLIKESIMSEIDMRKVIPGKYYDIFKNRIINAQHGNFGDVKKAVMEFYRDFKDRVPNEGFTLKNLMDLADKIDGNSATHERANTPYGHKIKDADDWWGMNAGKFLEEKKVRVTEGQLRKLIKESVMKAIMNEISSDMIIRARNKFYKKYGGTHWPGPDAKDFPRDEHGNLLYPKDKKSLASHYRNFDQAIDRAKHDEQMNDPVTREAMEIWNEVENDVDWEMGDEQWFRDEGGHGPVVGYITFDDGWEFVAEGYGYMQGGSIGDVEVESVSFKSPDGQEGSFRP